MHAGSPFSSLPRPLHRITFHLSSSSSSLQDHLCRIIFAGSSSQDPLCPLILILVAGSPPVQSKLSHITLNRINIAVVNKTKSRNILKRCKSNAFGEGSEDKFRRIDQRAITWPAPLTCLAQIYCSVNFSQFRLWWPADSPHTPRCNWLLLGRKLLVIWQR